MFLEQIEEPIFIGNNKCKGVIMRDKLLNVAEVAEVLGVKRKTIYMWKWQKKHLTFVKFGKSLRISERDLMDFIKKRKSHPSKS